MAAARKKQQNKRQQEKLVVQETVGHPPAEAKGLFSSIEKPVVILFLLAVSLYIFTVSFEYVLDDKLYVTHNQFVKEGFDGIGKIWKNDLLTGFYGVKKNLLEGGRYRPLPLTTHAIEYQLFGEWPGFSHLVNVLLYGLTAILLYIILVRLFPPDKKQPWYLSLAFVATALYIAHPLHTELIANIKSRDEIMSVVGGLFALYFVLKYLKGQQVQHLVLANLLFALGLFCKESAVTFLGIIPLTVFFFTKHKFKDVAIAVLPLFAVAGLYAWIRFEVLGSAQTNPVDELMNDPFLFAEGGEKLATTFFTWGLYIKLLILPHPLTHDYYPWHPISGEGHAWSQGFPYLNFSDPMVLMSMAVYALLIGIALRGLMKRSVFSYGILLYLGSFILFSNLVFGIGTFMNERFMYIPSLGFCIILGHLIVVKLPKMTKNPTVVKGVFFALLALYSIKTVHRSFAWFNDASLSMTDVKVSQNSAKVNMSAGGAFLEAAQEENDPTEKLRLLQLSEKHLRRSLELYPTYIPPMDLLGSTYFELRNYDYSITYFENCLKINPNFANALQNLLIVSNNCLSRGDHELALKGYKILINYDPNNVAAYEQMGEAYGKYQQNFDKALEVLGKANQLKPNNSSILQKIGVVYGMNGQSQLALQYFQQALSLDPDNARVMLNIGITYQGLGDQKMADEYIGKAFAVDPSLKTQNSPR